MICAECSRSYELTPQEQNLLNRFNVPNPKRCTTCRIKRRLAFWPFGKFHQRTDSLTGKPLISVFGKNARFPVTDRNNWHSDTWEAPQADIDWDKSFFDQFKELQEKTPHFHMLGDDKNINCDYGDDVWSCKDSYYCRSMLNVENSHYMYRDVDCKDCIDCVYSFNLDQCYQNTYCFNNYHVFFSFDSRDCIDSSFLFDCRGVKNSFMCWNLRNKEYCIRNQQFTQEEYQQKIQEINLSSNTNIAKYKEEYKDHLKTDAIHRAVYQNKSESCEGNYIEQSSNSKNAIFLEKSEQCINALRNLSDKDCMDICGLLDSELCYEIVQSSFSYNVQFASLSIRCKNSQYLDQCIDLSDCFGCVGLKKKQFTILNKQYTQAEYFHLREKLISKMKDDGEYGEYFPPSIAYNGYNHSFAHYYFPENKESARAQGYYWDDEDEVAAQGIPASELGDTITDYDQWINVVLQSTQTHRPYKLIEQEIQFYQRYQLPIPRIHPDERLYALYGQMTGINQRATNCSVCNMNIVTYYPEDWHYQHVVCEQCYRNSLY